MGFSSGTCKIWTVGSAKSKGVDHDKELKGVIIIIILSRGAKCPCQVSFDLTKCLTSACTRWMPI